MAARQSVFFTKTHITIVERGFWRRKTHTLPNEAVISIRYWKQDIEAHLRHEALKIDVRDRKKPLRIYRSKEKTQFPIIVQGFKRFAQDNGIMFHTETDDCRVSVSG